MEKIFPVLDNVFFKINVFLWKKIDAIIGNSSLNIPVVFLVYMFSLTNFL